MAINQNVADRDKAKALLEETIIPLIKDEYVKLSPHGQRCFCQMMHDRMAANLKLACDPKAEKTQPPEKKKANEVENGDLAERNSAFVDDAISRLEDVVSMCDDIPEAGEEFAESVREGAVGMMADITAKKRVTAKQDVTIDNWRSGLSRWLNRRDD